MPVAFVTVSLQIDSETNIGAGVTPNNHWVIVPEDWMSTTYRRQMAAMLRQTVRTEMLNDSSYYPSEDLIPAMIAVRIFPGSEILDVPSSLMPPLVPNAIY